ncbi:laminin subunit alpha [Octopus sinensis]|uniref:Laminin subunit alpha n=1 Tax=Octopus sinensis TaxID=2607531 RepID=A0A6P7TPL1_9MOLL|nr:laminin subunit alpha [Octopus sinensis]
MVGSTQRRRKRSIRPGSDHHDSQITTTMTTTMTTTAKILTVIFTVSAFWSPAEAQVRVLTPPYFNLAFGKDIVASSTCGVNSSSPELFCRLTGVAGDTKESDLRITINSGQLCEECDPTVESLSHHAELAIDGTERWWQSPPLSRGMEYNEVNVTIDLEQEFLVAYVFIKMANSPRPGVWALEKSTDFGKTWNPWQYFAGNPNECLQFFNASTSEVPEEDDEVICTTKFSKVVPLENGEIIVSLVDDRPNAQNFSNSQKLQDWTKATSVRLRLLQTKTLLGHLMAVRRQDPTVTRRYFYSIKDISIGGRCVCNGHAERCDKRDATQPNKLFCECHHNTCGPQCERCCPGFVQKKWQRVTTNKDFMCEPCNCHGHTNACVYDPEIDTKKLSLDIHGNYDGGGVCQNCEHNTKGINCEQCIDGFYRPFNVPKDVPNVCHQCQCRSRFSTGSCEEGSGRCMCKPQYTGENCDRCNNGYHNFPECMPCDCHVNGTSEGLCDVGGGQCPCKSNYMGRKCDTCRSQYYNFPECKECDCSRIGSQGPDCDVTTGQCRCQPGFNGLNCSTCAVGYHGFPTCTLCNCDVIGCTEAICESQTGRCICKPNYTGSQCERCVPGYYGYPYCYGLSWLEFLPSAGLGVFTHI